MDEDFVVHVDLEAEEFVFVGFIVCPGARPQPTNLEISEVIFFVRSNIQKLSLVPQLISMQMREQETRLISRPLVVDHMRVTD